MEPDDLRYQYFVQEVSSEEKSEGQTRNQSGCGADDFMLLKLCSGQGDKTVLDEMIRWRIKESGHG